jgi:hypothetical protein
MTAPSLSATIRSSSAQMSGALGGVGLTGDLRSRRVALSCGARLRIPLFRSVGCRDPAARLALPRKRGCRAEATSRLSAH